MALVEVGGVNFTRNLTKDEEDREILQEMDERDDFDIVDGVAGFVDEPSVKHNVYPTSDNEEETEGEVGFNLTVKRGDGNMYVGQIFYNALAFKETVLDHALKTSRNIRQVRYDKTKLAFECLGTSQNGNCQWRVYCSTRLENEKWVIRIYNGHHSCYPNSACDMLKVNVLANLFLDKIREEPDYFMPMKIEELVRSKWNITVSRPQCQAARNRALRWIDREYYHQFQRLRDYGAEIQNSNPNSSVAIETLTNKEGLDIFNRFYVCFDVLRRTWRATCKPLIGIDACHIKAQMKGQLLVALGRDDNNAIYPIAWAVVQVENFENWKWFLRKIQTDLILGDGDGFIIVSDRQKGLLKAVDHVMPNVEHRMCVRHIYANLKSEHGNLPEMKPLLWNLAWSYNEPEYAVNLARIREFDEAVYKTVMSKKPRTWCRAFFRIGNFCEDVENNSTESFNSTIVKAREKPLVPMLEIIARQAMIRIVKRSVISLQHQGKCTPYVEDELARTHDLAAGSRVFGSTNHQYQVILDGCAHRVNIERRSCSCRKWDVRGIPCEHAYGVLTSKKLNVEDYVASWFQTSLWIQTYAEGLVPLRGAKYWPVGSDRPIFQPPPPAQAGRPKKSKKDKRIKGRNESPTKKKKVEKKRIMHCGICGSASHNARTHKKRSQVAEGESSQTVASQTSQADATQG